MAIKYGEWLIKPAGGYGVQPIFINFQVQNHAMKRILLFIAVIACTCISCRWMGHKKIQGNGNLITRERSVSRAERIKLSGSYDVEITQGPVTSVKIEADENIIPFILTSEEDGFLLIKSKEHVSLSSTNDIKIYITTAKLEQLHLAGSGNIIGKTKFTGGNKLSLKIAGSGDIKLEVNTPDLTADIAGSGSMTLSGETKNETIHISGVGDYNAEGLKAENAKVKIAGTGDVKLYADLTLDVNIAGGGSVYYKGAATVKQRVAGVGSVTRIQ